MRSKKSHRISQNHRINSPYGDRRSIKLILIDPIGCKCQICGYNRCIGNLSFHHKDPLSKKFNISTEILLHSWETLLREASKCIVVCHNCHGEINSGLLDVSRIPTIKLTSIKRFKKL